MAGRLELGVATGLAHEQHRDPEPEADHGDAEKEWFGS
jgi:hypothetical protein